MHTRAGVCIYIFIRCIPVKCHTQKKGRACTNEIYKHKKKKRAPGARHIPALIVFITVTVIYAINGNSAANSSGDTRAASAPPQTIITTDSAADPAVKKAAADAPAAPSSNIKIITTTPPDHTSPIPDEYLTALSSSNVIVLMNDGSTQKVPLELYTARVVASEMPSTFSYEALKAQAIAARTYAEGRREQYEQGKSKPTPKHMCCRPAGDSTVTKLSCAR